MIVSADIGGTKTNIGLSSRSDPVNYHRQFTYLNEEFDSFEDIVRHFVPDEDIDIMVLGIVGPISSRVVQLTNLYWKINADRLEAVFDCEVHLLNDLQAFAFCLPHLDPHHIELVHEADVDTHSKIEVIAASGTGLGVAKLFHDDHSIVFASEGGHIGFSPKSKFQQSFFEYVQSKTLHVSCEMMMSSIGFRNVKGFILETDFFRFSQKFITDLKSTNNTPIFLSGIIEETGFEYETFDVEQSKLIIQEISFMLGSFLGDLSLIHLPSKIYLTGGIGRNIVIKDSLKAGFLAKANMSHVVKNVSLAIITDPDVGLHGTSWFAEQQLKL